MYIQNLSWCPHALASLAFLTMAAICAEPSYARDVCGRLALPATTDAHSDKSQAELIRPNGTPGLPPETKTSRCHSSAAVAAAKRRQRMASVTAASSTPRSPLRFPTLLQMSGKGKSSGLSHYIPCALAGLQVASHPHAFDSRLPSTKAKQNLPSSSHNKQAPIAAQQANATCLVSLAHMGSCLTIFARCHARGYRT